jgi:hypothetical protein
MFDDNSLRENFKKILEIKKVFEKAKKDEWKTFLDKINNLDKSILQEQLDFYGNETEKVKKIRYDIIKSILDWIKVSNNDIEEFKKIEKNKYDWKDIFRSWKNFSILYSIYYFDKKDFVNNTLKELNDLLVKDLWLEWITKTNIVDFQWAQNFWLENFWTAIYNNSHKSQRSALQLNITSFWNNNESLKDNLLSIWLWWWPDVKKWSKRGHEIININDLTYSKILKELEKYKDDIINDNYTDENKIINKQSYWIYSPWQNASKWDEFYDKWIMWIWWDELWNLKNYKNKKEIREKFIEIQWTDNPMNLTHACEDFVRNIKVGDIIIPKQWRKNYLWYWIVEWNYEFDINLVEFKNIRKVKWIKKWIWKEEWDIIWKSLTNIDKYPEYVEKLKILLWINSSNNNIMKKSDRITKLLDSKKQIILYWPPWTGKTYNIKNIIQNHSWESYNYLKNDWRVEFITFHQSFSYEEFIEWIKPDLDWSSEEISYKIEDGIFKKIVNKARRNIIKSLSNKNTLFEEAFNELTGNQIEEWINIKIKLKNKWSFFNIIDYNEKTIYFEKQKGTSNHTLSIKTLKNMFEDWENMKIKGWLSSYYEWILTKLFEIKENKIWIKEEIKNYYLIIDEINRWNISKIFGELITLLEADKRLWEENEIITKLPYSKEDFWIPSNLYIVATMNTSDKSIVSLDTALRRRFWFKEMLPDYSLPNLNKNIEWINLAQLLQKINNRIEYLIDKDHLIWHSYFLKTDNILDIKLVIYNEILPLLEEYFYWEEEKIRKVLWKSLFKTKQFNNNLFENKSDFENDENQYEINEDLNNEEFINALKNIIKSNEED